MTRSRAPPSLRETGVVAVLASLMLRLKPRSPLPRISSPLLRTARTGGDDDDDSPRAMLPTTRRGLDKAPSPHSYLAFLARRYFVLLLATCAVLFFLGRVFFRRQLSVVPAAPPVPDVHPEQTLVPAPLPPTYSRYHYELLRLPQHHWERTRPGPEEKFFYVAGHARGALAAAAVIITLNAHYLPA